LAARALGGTSAVGLLRGVDEASEQVPPRAPRSLWLRVHSAGLQLSASSAEWMRPRSKSLPAFGETHGASRRSEHVPGGPYGTDPRRLGGALAVGLPRAGEVGIGASPSSCRAVSRLFRSARVRHRPDLSDERTRSCCGPLRPCR